MNLPSSLTNWLASEDILPILEYYANARTLSQPQPCSESYIAGKRVEMKEMGITYKRIDWK